jgi:hypothetical protein
LSWKRLRTPRAGNTVDKSPKSRAEFGVRSKVRPVRNYAEATNNGEGQLIHITQLNLSHLVMENCEKRISSYLCKSKKNPKFFLRILRRHWKQKI